MRINYFTAWSAVIPKRWKDFFFEKYKKFLFLGFACSSWNKKVFNVRARKSHFSKYKKLFQNEFSFIFQGQKVPSWNFLILGFEISVSWNTRKKYFFEKIWEIFNFRAKMFHYLKNKKIFFWKNIGNLFRAFFFFFFSSLAWKVVQVAPNSSTLFKGIFTHIQNLVYF